MLDVASSVDILDLVSYVYGSTSTASHDEDSMCAVLVKYVAENVSQLKDFEEMRRLCRNGGAFAEDLMQALSNKASETQQAVEEGVLD